MDSRTVASGDGAAARFFRSRVWRVPATGLAFAIFGLVGTVFSLTVFPLLYIWPAAQSARRRRARALIAGVFRTYLKLLNGLGLISFSICGREHLHTPGALIIANHPSLLDVVFLMALTPANCVVKASLWRNPFTAAAVRLAEYIPNNAEDVYERCLATLALGDKLIIFPEGTRSVPGAPLKFNRGPAYVAMGAQAPVVPVVIRCEPATLMKHQPWYAVPATPAHFSFAIAPPLTVLDTPAQALLPSQAARRLTKYWQGHFEAALAAPRVL